MRLVECYLIIKAYAEIMGISVASAIKKIEDNLNEEETKRFVDEIKKEIINNMCKKLDESILYGEEI